MRDRWRGEARPRKCAASPTRPARQLLVVAFVLSFSVPLTRTAWRSGSLN
jgi:hypothetical protein